MSSIKADKILSTINNNIYVRIIVHMLFWSLVYVFLLLVFRWNNRNSLITIVLTSCLVPISAGVVYFFNYFLIPKFLLQKRYGRFFYFSFYAILASLWISFLIVMFVLIYVVNRPGANLDPTYIHPEFQVAVLYFIVFLAISIKQVKRLFFVQQEKSELEKMKLTTELKLKEAELKLLKAQIQPHFLFNTLNNLYGLTLEKSNEAPNLVLRLSDILDYILYRCNEKYVPLYEEIKNLKNYIEIEKIRHTSRLRVEVSVPEENHSVKIAPLLLIPFVENAFKHGVSNNPGEAYIQLELKIVDKAVEFDLSNSKNPFRTNEKNGIGLENVKKRLELLYPDNYDLQIENKEKEFHIHLVIKSQQHV